MFLSAPPPPFFLLNMRLMEKLWQLWVYLQFTARQLLQGHLEQEKTDLEGRSTDWQRDATFVAE